MDGSIIILGNEKLIKVVTAIDSSDNKRMSDGEIQELTGLNSETVVKSIELLEKSKYIITTVEEFPGRSLHKCVV